MSPLKIGGLFVAVCACLALTTESARPEVFAEVYGGWNFAQHANDPFYIPVDPVFGVRPTTPSFKGKIDSAFEAGVKLGDWFTQTSPLGAYLDFSYHQVDFPEQTGIDTIYWADGPDSETWTAHSDGEVETLALLLACRYGMQPDDQATFGRLQPYLAAGPALFFSRQKITVTAIGAVTGVTPDELGSDTSVDLGLAAEAGLRWMASEHVSAELSYKFRYVKSTYDYWVADEEDYVHHVQFEPTYKFHSVQAGIAYHF